MAADLTNRAVAEAMGWSNDEEFGIYSRPEPFATATDWPAYLDDPALLGEMLEWLHDNVGAIDTGNGLRCKYAEHDLLRGTGDTLQRAVAALVVAVKEAGDAQ